MTADRPACAGIRKAPSRFKDMVSGFRAHRGGRRNVAARLRGMPAIDDRLNGQRRKARQASNLKRRDSSIPQMMTFPAFENVSTADPSLPGSRGKRRILGIQTLGLQGQRWTAGIASQEAEFCPSGFVYRVSDRLTRAPGFEQSPQRRFYSARAVAVHANACYGGAGPWKREREPNMEKQSGDGLRRDVDRLKEKVGEGEKNLAVLEVSVVGVLERFRADQERFRADQERFRAAVERLRTDIAKMGEENAKNANTRDWRLIIFMFVLVSIATSIILAVLGT